MLKCNFYTSLPYCTFQLSFYRFFLIPLPQQVKLILSSPIGHKERASHGSGRPLIVFSKIQNFNMQVD